MKTLVITSILLMIPLYYINSQETSIPDSKLSNETLPIIKIEKKDKATLNNISKTDLNVKSEFDFRTFIQYYNHNIKTHDIDKYNIVSSFRKSIRFGGFWEGYAIINITPDIYIQPLNFVSIYASHNYSNYVPVSSIKENINLLLAESAAVLTIDNAFKFLFSFKPAIFRSIAEFAAKNLAIALIKNTLKPQNKVPEYKFYYYSIRVNF